MPWQEMIQASCQWPEGTYYRLLLDSVLRTLNFKFVQPGLDTFWIQAPGYENKDFRTRKGGDLQLRNNAALPGPAADIWAVGAMGAGVRVVDLIEDTIPYEA